MPYKVTVPEGRTVAEGHPVISQKQDDGPDLHWFAGDTIKKSDIPDDGWAWLIEQGIVVSTGRS